MKQTEGRKSKKVHEPIVDLDGEVWKDVVGYEGLYEVSNKGRVKTLKYKRSKTRNERLKDLQDFKGYKFVNLCKEYKAVRKAVHRLVYEAFVGYLPECNLIGKGKDRLEINHKDENPSNNCVENLELVSHYYNVNYGNHNIKNSKARERKIFQYSYDGKLVKIWENTKDCHKSNFSRWSVYVCCNKTTHKKTYKGFIWSYEQLTEDECLKIAKQSDIDKNKRATKRVYQYSFDGELIKTWDSIIEASRNGFTYSSIKYCLNNKHKTHKGYIWSTEPISSEQCKAKVPKKKEIKEKKKPHKIYQYTKDLELVFVWDKISDCVKNGYFAQHIGKCCNGKRKTHKGYIWSYEPIENK